MVKMSSKEKDLIRAYAKELGFSVCGFAHAEPLSFEAKSFLEWIENGWHGQMQYLARNIEKRIDPTKVVPNAKTVIVVGASYWISKWSLAEMILPNSGRVARYARFKDYHKVLKERLYELEKYLLLYWPTKHSKVYVDTGPILERAWAARAGIGFIGKNTNLVNLDYGQWLLLGVIITEVEIEPDSSIKNYCGRCSKCIDACPTSAIVEPYKLDARRCISYLTIENKGHIPIKLRSQFKGAFFGCDRCLEVCPWNQKAQSAGLLNDYHIAELDGPNLLRWLSMDLDQLKQTLKHTSLLRCKVDGLIRNACIALAETGDQEALDILATLSRSKNRFIAEYSTWAYFYLKSRLG